MYQLTGLPQEGSESGREMYQTEDELHLAAQEATGKDLRFIRRRTQKLHTGDR